jgi:L-lactate dehydrogenase complex protein LldF
MEHINVIDHATRSAQFNRDENRVDWHDKTLWFVREKRDKAAHQVDEWEQLRSYASQIKENVLGNLHKYLVQFEQQAIANGVQVHWAATAKEHNEIVHGIIASKGIKRIVKSKSMLTEECHLNEYLESKGIEVIDTDLGERIVQLAKESPSHIVLPCIHKKKEEIGELFSKHLGTPEGIADPQVLTSAARAHLRQHFMQSDVALTGVNFAIAETGEIVVCTNEGNADLGVQLAETHIACMGIEKIIPERKHLAVFLRLLARSATGQPITTYSQSGSKVTTSEAP